VLLPDRGTVSHLSGSERTLLGTVGVGSTASGLAAEDRGVWVSDARTGRVTLIERERLTVAATARTRGPPLVGPYADAGLLAMGFGSLWFASGEQTISRIDPRTGRVTARIRPVTTGESDGAITTGAGSVWVAGPVQGSPLTRIDPSRNAVLARIALSKFRSGGATVAGGNVWVADPGGDKVWRVDPMRNVPVSTTDVGAAPIGVVSGHGSVWVANAGDGTVSRIDPVTGRVIRTIAVGGSPNGLAVTDDAVWVTVA
jgi:YVTN family beta-propeller protein